MAYTPKRRRGPNKLKPEAETAAVATSVPQTGAEPEIVATTAPQEPAAPAKRRRRASVGGFHKKLDVPAREGYQRRWFNDIPGRIANAEDLAYTHVTEPGIKSDSPDSRVRRLVGTQASGAPLYAYLMETPDSEYQQGVDEKESVHRQVDDAIRAGRDTTGRVENSYGEGSIGTR